VCATFGLSTSYCNLKQRLVYPNTLAKSYFYCTQGVKCKTGSGLTQQTENRKWK